MKGIDVSYSQKNVDWNAVKAAGRGDFAMIRAGYGRFISQKDEQFENHYAGAKAAGIPVGAYWYSYATTPDEARQEARVCLEVIRGKQFEFPICFDMEKQYAFNTGRANCSAMIRAFCNELENEGYFAGLYMSAEPFKACTDESIRTRYALWLADWRGSLHYDGAVGIWQSSETGRVDGVRGNVDLDEGYVDYPAIIVGGGFNGFPKPEPLPYTPGMTNADAANVAYAHGMTAGDVQTLLRWVAEKGAGNYPDTEEGFRAFLSENT